MANDFFTEELLISRYDDYVSKNLIFFDTINIKNDFSGSNSGFTFRVPSYPTFKIGLSNVSTNYQFYALNQFVGFSEDDYVRVDAEFDIVESSLFFKQKESTEDLIDKMVSSLFYGLEYKFCQTLLGKKDSMHVLNSTYVQNNTLNNDYELTKEYVAAVTSITGAFVQRVPYIPVVNNTKLISRSDILQYQTYGIYMGFKNVCGVAGEDIHNAIIADLEDDVDQDTKEKKSYYIKNTLMYPATNLNQGYKEPMQWTEGIVLRIDSVTVNDDDIEVTVTSRMKEGKLENGIILPKGVHLKSNLNRYSPVVKRDNVMRENALKVNFVVKEDINIASNLTSGALANIVTFQIKLVKDGVRDLSSASPTINTSSIKTGLEGSYLISPMTSSTLDAEAWKEEGYTCASTPLGYFEQVFFYPKAAVYGQIKMPAEIDGLNNLKLKETSSKKKNMPLLLTKGRMAGVSEGKNKITMSTAVKFVCIPELIARVPVFYPVE